MKFIPKLVIVIFLLDYIVLGGRIQLERRKRRARDDLNLAVVAHSLSYGDYSQKTPESFFSAFKEINEIQGTQNYKVIIGLAKDPLPGESDRHSSGKKSRALVVSFRGTANWDNIFRDLEYYHESFGGNNYCVGCKVHQGIWKAYANVKINLFKYLNEILVQYHNDQHTHIHHVIFTGHSLGGAMANIGVYNFGHRRIMARSESTRNDKNYMFDIENVSLITFGAPRVGNPEFKNYMDNSLGLKYNYRIIYGNDPVTGAPPKSIGQVIGSNTFQYLHCGIEIRYKDENFNTPTKANSSEDTCANETLSFLSLLRSLVDVGDHSQYKRIDYRSLWNTIKSTN
jgi:hypothetical protein